MSQINTTSANTPVAPSGATSASGAADPALLAEELLVDRMYNNGMEAIAKQDEALATLYNEMLKQTQKLEGYSAVQSQLNAILQAKRNGEEQVPISALVINTVRDMIEDGLISMADAKKMFNFSFDTVKYPYAYDHHLVSVYGAEISKAESLQKSISEEQASLGAANEQQNLKINEAVGKRSAIFTQLQTVLNAIIQARANLANW